MHFHHQVGATEGMNLVRSVVKNNGPLVLAAPQNGSCCSLLRPLTHSYTLLSPAAGAVMALEVAPSLTPTATSSPTPTTAALASCAALLAAGIAQARCVVSNHGATVLLAPAPSAAGVVPPAAATASTASALGAGSGIGLA
eukprot:17438-Pelagomonas_calceolata.AAC.8